MCLGPLDGVYKPIHMEGEEIASNTWRYSLLVASTYQEEKELALKMWRYLRDHPHIRRKGDLPTYMYSRLAVYEGYCPVCTIFKDFCEAGQPHNCPLRGCTDKGGAYMGWLLAESDIKRRDAAIEIIQLLEKWDGEI